MQQVQAPVIPIIGKLIADNPGTISLGQGVVHYSPPPAISASVAEALRDDPILLNRYGDVRGIQALQELIVAKLAMENRIEAESECIVCTAGSNMGFINSVLAIADSGDEIILLSPYYFNHHMAIEMAGCRPVVVETNSEHQFDVAMVNQAITSRTRAVVTVSPNNPTGAVYSEDALTELNRLCAARGIYHIADEAYEYFTYGEARHFSPGSLAGAGEHTVSLFSLSKAYGMAGWRVGYMVAPKQLVAPIKKIQDTNLICPALVCQVAAAAALRVGSGWCLEQVASLHAVRGMAIEALSSLGDRCRFASPQGAFYLFLQLQASVDDMTLVEMLIRQHKVAVLPGSAFGATQGCSLRLSYGALDSGTIAEGLGRLRRGLDSLL